MMNQITSSQSIVIDQEKLDPTKPQQRLALFNSDGTPYTGLGDPAPGSGSGVVVVSTNSQHLDTIIEDNPTVGVVVLTGAAASLLSWTATSSLRRLLIMNKTTSFVSIQTSDGETTIAQCFPGNVIELIDLGTGEGAFPRTLSGLQATFPPFDGSGNLSGSAENLFGLAIEVNNEEFGGASGSSTPIITAVAFITTNQPLVDAFYAFAPPGFCLWLGGQTDSAEKGPYLTNGTSTLTPDPRYPGSPLTSPAILIHSGEWETIMARAMETPPIGPGMTYILPAGYEKEDPLVPEASIPTQEVLHDVSVNRLMRFAPASYLEPTVRQVLRCDPTNYDIGAWTIPNLKTITGVLDMRACFRVNPRLDGSTHFGELFSNPNSILGGGNDNFEWGTQHAIDGFLFDFYEWVRNGASSEHPNRPIFDAGWKPNQWITARRVHDLYSGTIKAQLAVDSGWDEVVGDIAWKTVGQHTYDPEGKSIENSGDDWWVGNDFDGDIEWLTVLEDDEVLISPKGTDGVVGASTLTDAQSNVFTAGGTAEIALAGPVVILDILSRLEALEP